MASSTFETFTPDQGVERLYELLDIVATTGKGIAIYRQGEFDPDSPDIHDPIAYLVGTKSIMISQAREAELRAESVQLQVWQGHVATRVNAVEQAIQAYGRTNSYITAQGLTELAKAIEAFIERGDVAPAATVGATS